VRYAFANTPYILLMENIPRIMSRAFPTWIRYLALVSSADVRGFLLYLPNPEPSVLPQVTIPTPLKIGKRSLKLIAGGTRYAGRLIGAGLDIPRDPPGMHQVWRMDYHLWHRGLPWAGPREISVWRDGNYHFHVSRPPR
jgi:hypothetical protein